MPQQHLDRLTALDASFLHQEGPSSHMHVGALCRFEGPPPTFEELLDTLRMRLHLVPRYRQRLQLPPAGTGPPPGRVGCSLRRSPGSPTPATPRCRGRGRRTSCCASPAVCSPSSSTAS